MATINVAVFNPRGYYLDGLHEREDRSPLSGGLTQAIISSGGVNTDAVVTMSTTITVAANGKHTC